MKSEVRSQKSELRGQESGVRSRESGVRGTGVLESGAPNGRARVKILEENRGRRNLAFSEKLEELQNGYADFRIVD